MKKEIVKILWISLGVVSLGVGAVGAVLPFLPTFPFLMLTLFCFAKSSERWHRWFISTKLYKNNLETYVVSRSMTMRTKSRIMLTVTLVMAFGFIMMSRVPAARVVLVFVWVFHILYFIFGIKTQKAGCVPEKKGEQQNA
ncbi:YbaN family protein [Bariatricus massiliensis]|uniref:YbaN family protein n=1 Tax=Bariatricus massiliensis TaxID=1745713 RepID=A0ABS8DF95_9FIRM|nr:YbaN family protein [Bariatricus massiliensis]MCB7303973.1 YbaN family protein [Bariatricus massiliensis]MCB7374596.1 YbaN family protein [Bariatricus massiliensis]MCB7387083.1 YbaN family protein [Bariatricus massiliensis]MCB7411245.1 YbaN family protein [Bariatricus massiliensis]MCQ5252811.1 YbaN family protein [Bariatricus massiliensis]